MKKLTMALIAAFAMTNMFAQANENAAAQEKATPAAAAQEVEKVATPTTQEDTNKTAEEAPQEK